MRKTLSKLLVICAVAGLSASMSACASNPRVVLVPPITWVQTEDGKTIPSDVIQLGPGVRGPVYVRLDGQWVLSDGPVDIPEGWVAAPPPPQPEQ